MRKNRTVPARPNPGPEGEAPGRRGRGSGARIALPVGLPALALAFLLAAGGPSQGATYPMTFDLTSPSSSARLDLPPFPPDRWRIDLVATYRSPGTILDSAGAFTPNRLGLIDLTVLPDRRVLFRLFNPHLNSPVRTLEGWHELVSRTRLVPGIGARIVVEAWGNRITLWVNGRREAWADIPGTLVRPVFVGDFPGDENLGRGWRTSLIGRVRLDYFGDPVPSAFLELQGKGGARP